MTRWLHVSSTDVLPRPIDADMTPVAPQAGAPADRGQRRRKHAFVGGGHARRSLALAYWRIGFFVAGVNSHEDGAPILVAVDFDGILHLGPWEGTSQCNGEPANIAWLMSLIGKVRIAIFSCRNHWPAGTKAVKEFLISQGLTFADVESFSYPASKPGAHMFIDDRAWGFTGRLPTVEEILEFKPWQSNTASPPNSPWTARETAPGRTWTPPPESTSSTPWPMTMSISSGSGERRVPTTSKPSPSP